MALFRKFFYRKPPDGLLEISERVYVFDCCFTTDVLEDDEFKVYMCGIVSQLRDHFPDASFMAFNYREGEHQSLLTEVLAEYDMTVMDYPRQYEGCPLLSMEMIHHFLRSSESWLSLSQQNILLMHCERGGWPVLAFMLAGLLIYRKQYTGEQKTLDMIYKQAPRELLQFLSPLNPLPSQIRYLQYISRRNVGSIWPPLDRALTLDCIILRFIPNFDGEGGCRPLFRIYGQDPFIAADQTPKVLFSTPKRSKAVRTYRQADCELVKIDIHCHIQGDVVLECISLDDDLEREVMMFRVMFNTAFIRSNILMLNRDEIDILWDAKDRFSRNFRAEVLFSEMDAANSIISLELPPIDDKDGLPVEAFAKVQEIFSNMDWLDTKGDATLKVLQQITSSNISREKQGTLSFQIANADFLPQKSNLYTHNEHFKTNATHDINAKSASSLSSWQSNCTLNQSSDTSTKSENSQLQNVHAVLPSLTQPKIVSKSTQSSNSGQVSPINSIQSSPMHVSRYHSAPSSPVNLGITALLHDHSSFGRSEVAHSTSLSLSDASHLPGSTSDIPLETKAVSPMVPPSSQPPPPPPPPSPQPCFSIGTSLLASSTLSTALAFPSSKCPYGSDQVTSKTVVSVAALTTKYPSPLTTAQKQSSPLQSKSVPPPVPPPMPPLLVSLRKSPFPSSLSKKSPVVADTNSFAPSSCSTLSLEGKVSSLVNYKASSQEKGNSFPLIMGSSFSPVKCKNSSPIKGKASLPRPSITAPPPPPLPTSFGRSSLSLTLTLNSSIPPPPPPPPSPPHPPSALNNNDMPANAPLPLPPSSSYRPSLLVKNTNVSTPPPPPPCSLSISLATPPIQQNPKNSSILGIPPQTSAPFPPNNPQNSSISGIPLVPTPPLPPNNPQNFSISSIPSVPPPPLPPHNSSSHNPSISSIPAVSPPPSSLKGLDSSSGPPPPPTGINGPLGVLKGRSFARSTSNRCLQPSGKRTLKPLHWVKVTRAMQGSLWAETQKLDEASKAPEFDMLELESLFSAAVPNSERGSGDKSCGRSSLGQKSDRVQLIDLRRANNCEIMLTKVKIPLTDLLSSVLTLDDSVLDVDQVDNLIKFCPTKEEMDLLKNFNGDKESLGKCEQYFLELMKVPRVESKLRVFSFKIQFRSQVSELSGNLNIVNSAAKEIRNSVRLKRIMQTILSLGNALNQGTARGSAIGFRLDSLLKLTETRSRNNKMTLMHYLCKVLAEKLPELLSFPKDLVSLEVSSKIQLKTLAEEMQAISKGLEKVEQELTASENDGPISDTFCKTLKEFLVGAEAEVRALTSLYSNVGRNADALALYFGEDPARCPFEQVIGTLLNFVRLFIRAHEENCKLLELEKKRQQKEAENEKKLNAAKKEAECAYSPSKKAKNN